MFRTILLGFCAVMIFAAPVHAQPFGMDPEDMEATSNPDHRGWTGNDEMEPVDWIDIDAGCKECQPLADSYNKVMRQLLYTRFWISYISDMSRRRSDMDRFMKTLSRKSDGAVVGQDGMATEHEQLASAMMNYEIGLDELKSKLPALRAQEESLKALAEDLVKQLDICEKERCQKIQGQGNLVQLKGVNPKAASALPFDWKGPYPEVCHKCAKLAQRLNEIPDLARGALAGLEDASANLMSAEVEMAALQMEHQAFIFANNPLDGRTEKQRADEHAKKTKEMEKSLKELERIKEAAEDAIAKYEADLDAIIKNFNDTLALYNECVPTCPKETGMSEPEKKTEYALGAGVDFNPDKCFAKINYDGYMIGPNSQYGTGAQVKEKARDMATGAAMGALGSVLGGSGVSLGGFGKGVGSPRGGGGGNSDGPRLDKNPLGKGDYQPFKWEGFYIGAKGGWTDDGFVLNEKIEESPDGNSTFHATWLQDEKGRTILPTKFYIFDIYRDHKLTVWWTYDHWTDGVHDYHDEGSETTQWREDLGSFKVRFGGEKGIENSLWYQSGFDTAVKGVRHMGALYAGIGPQDLTGCGLNAITHLTLPSQDPVITTPFVLNLRTDAEKAADDAALARSLMITMPPF